MARKRSSEPERQPATGLTSLGLPAGYSELLEDLMGRVRSAQLKAAVAVNRELTALYWRIGESIVQRQRQEGWGRGVIDRLARDLQAAFPGVQGFSPSNVWRVCAFYLAYCEGVTNLAQPVRETGAIPSPRRRRDLLGPQRRTGREGQGPHERLWYARMAVEHGWSRAVLIHQIEGGLQANKRMSALFRDPALPKEPGLHDLGQQDITE